MAASLILFDIIKFSLQDQGVRLVHPHFVSGTEKLSQYALIGEYQTIFPNVSFDLQTMGHVAAHLILKHQRSQ